MVISDKQLKVHKLRNGCLFGWAGSLEDAERLKIALRKDQAPPPNLELDAIMVEPMGDVYEFEGNLWRKMATDYTAIGSGSPYALGAMDAGADAVTAATIGSKRDIGSGGRIRVVRL